MNRSGQPDALECHTIEGSEVLRDKHGNRIGEIRTSGAKQILRGKYGNRLGEYDARTNRTVNKYGNLVGSGNLLATLLK